MLCTCLSAMIASVPCKNKSEKLLKSKTCTCITWEYRDPNKYEKHLPQNYYCKNLNKSEAAKLDKNLLFLAKYNNYKKYIVQVCGIKIS